MILLLLLGGLLAPPDWYPDVEVEEPSPELQDALFKLWDKGEIRVLDLKSCTRDATYGSQKGS